MDGWIAGAARRGVQGEWLSKKLLSLQSEVPLVPFLSDSCPSLTPGFFSLLALHPLLRDRALSLEFAPSSRQSHSICLTHSLTHSRRSAPQFLQPLPPSPPSPPPPPPPPPMPAALEAAAKRRWLEFQCERKTLLCCIHGFVFSDRMLFERVLLLAFCLLSRRLFPAIHICITASPVSPLGICDRLRRVD